MKKSDIGLAGIVYTILLVFFVMTMGLRADARIYPLVVMAILFLLNTLFLCQSVWKMKREKGHLVNDLESLFEGLLPRQFTGVVISCVIYVVVIGWLGFYVSTLIYLLGTLLFLKVPKLHIAITVAGFELLIYTAFTLFLHVPLPAGLLF